MTQVEVPPGAMGNVFSWCVAFTIFSLIGLQRVKLAQLWYVPLFYPSVLLLPTKWDSRWTLAHTSHIPLPIGTHTHMHTHTHTNPSVPAYPLGSYALPRLDTVQGLHLSAPLRPPSQLMAGQPSETSKTDETRPPDTSILGSQAGPKLLLTAWKFLRFLPYLSSVSNS